MRGRIALAAVVLAGTTVAGQTTPPAGDLAARVQSHYDTVKDFQADFTSVYRGGFTRPMPEERGKVKVKKPGRMSWVYQGADPKEYWSDGSRIYTYLVERNEVMISPLPTGSEGSTSLLFLMDRGNLTRDFTPSLTGDQPAGQWRLTLVPKRPDPDVTSLVLVVDRATFKLTGFEIKDDQGGTTTMKFQNLKENVGLRDQDFVKGLPRNAKIIK
jgi:outer membrane lipoprotein-sorting protein